MTLKTIAVAAALSLIPAAGWSCPGCMVNDPKTASTYLGMTLILSALPLLLVSGLGYWFWRREP
jgi:hypothetical protein